MLRAFIFHDANGTSKTLGFAESTSPDRCRVLFSDSEHGGDPYYLYLTKKDLEDIASLANSWSNDGLRFVEPSSMAKPLAEPDETEEGEP